MPGKKKKGGKKKKKGGKKGGKKKIQKSARREAEESGKNFFDPHLEKLKEEKSKRVEGQIKDIFDLFKGENGLERSDFGTTIRALNLNPCENDIHEMMLEFHDSVISYEEYLSVVTDIVINGAFRERVLCRDSEDNLLKAFKVLDREKKGFIDTKVLKSKILKMGEALDEKEMEEMFQVAEDPEMHVVKYEDYCAVLSTGDNDY